MVQARYQYGTSPRKVYPDYNEDRQRKNLRVVRKNKKQETSVNKNHAKMMVTILGLFAVLLTISVRNSQIDKKFSQIQEQKLTLSTLQKENEQLKVNIENSLNAKSIEKAATDLGMQKLSNKQTIYITLPKKDYIEKTPEKVELQKEPNWFQKLLSKFF